MKALLLASLLALLAACEDAGVTGPEITESQRLCAPNGGVNIVRYEYIVCNNGAMLERNYGIAAGRADDSYERQRSH